MAILDVSASGASTSSGTAIIRLNMLLGGSDGASVSSGTASATIVSGVQVTQAGVSIDVDGGTIRVTQTGVQADVDRTVPIQVTTGGVTLDVDRTVPIQVTTGGVSLDVDRIVPARVSTMGVQIDARYNRPRTLTMCWEFHVFNRAGIYLTYLDNAFDKSYLTQLWDVGGGSFSLPVDDAKATTTNLRVGNIVKVRYANVDIGAWIIENVGRTFVDTGEGQARILTVSGRGLMGSLQKGIVYPADLMSPEETERAFVDVTKAEILLTLYEEYVARGGGLFTTSFTDTLDTNLDGWTDNVSLKYRTGQTLLDVLRQLQGFGLEVVAQPDKTLDAFLSAGQDRSSSVVFRYGQNMLACSVAEVGSDMANVVLGEAQALLDEDVDAASVATYGRQEAFLPVRNTDDADQIAAANEQFLALFATPPQSIALQVATFPYYPLTDYELGDYVHVVVPDDLEGDYRILAIAMQENTGPCDLRVTLELNSVQSEYLARVQRAMDASLASIPPGTGASTGLASSSTTSSEGGGATDLDGLTDVVISTPADNEVLAYDNGSGNWINQTAEEAGLTPDTLTTKGDVLTRSSSAYGRLGVGTDGHVLTADSAEPVGIKWSAVSAADAADVTYTPAVLADWDGSADPGDVDNALDQLAERVADVEGAAGHDPVTLSVAADTMLSLSTQEIGLDVQGANEVLAGPTAGADAAPAFRALIAADVGTGTPDGSKYLRDDMSWQTPAGGGGAGDVATDEIWDAAGDIVQGTGANTATRLAIGTAGHVLSVNSGATAAEWRALPILTESRIGVLANPLTGTSLSVQEAMWSRVVCFADCTLITVKASISAASANIRCRVLEVDTASGNATVSAVVATTAYQAVTPPEQATFTLSASLTKNKFYAILIEVESGATLRMYSNTVQLGYGSLLPSPNATGGNASRDVGVGGTLTAYGSSLPTMWLTYTV